MGKHTPGPWRTRDHHAAGIDIIAGRAEIGNIGAPSSDGAPNWPEVKANARLITAAPDMLAACESIRDRVDGALDAFDADEQDSGEGLELVRIRAMARAAIARAKGDK
jgi:hypothetical protein